ncbi:hypothetical protein EH165_00655 [Nakamurella antarctica]|uniref:Uncharacterized protein n=1 Tax=Nakamurella antarctica TaxID=1902245 RepID=A0A3G8ZJF3_9ACTN|nr:hypothetical protein [Nakamurella antarctica]AZI56897.1 hypothetical protein EH165_00655 [Nakamurella antarctica]
MTKNDRPVPPPPGLALAGIVLGLFLLGFFGMQLVRSTPTQWSALAGIVFGVVLIVVALRRIVARHPRR